MFSVSILGSSAAAPTLERHCSSQVVNIDGCRMLLDCGEATQNQLHLFRQHLRSFDTVIISHLHGDHWFGLPGLLSSMHLSGRTEPMDIYAPVGLRQALDAVLAISGSGLQYELRIHEITATEPTTILKNGKCKVTAFPLLHTVPTYGFIFEEAEPEFNLKKNARAKYGLSDQQCREVKAGADVVKPDGTVIPNAEMTLPRRRARRYAYCCDTGYFDELPRLVHGVDMLCLESTFDHSFRELAAEKGHLTARQAAQVAEQAEVGKLLLTHFSARYKGDKMSIIMREALSEYDNVIFAEDGQRYEVESR